MSSESSPKIVISEQEKKYVEIFMNLDETNSNKVLSEIIQKETLVVQLQNHIYTKYLKGMNLAATFPFGWAMGAVGSHIAMNTNHVVVYPLLFAIPNLMLLLVIAAIYRGVEAKHQSHAEYLNTLLDPEVYVHCFNLKVLFVLNKTFAQHFSPEHVLLEEHNCRPRIYGNDTSIPIQIWRNAIEQIILRNTIEASVLKTLSQYQLPFLDTFKHPTLTDSAILSNRQAADMVKSIELLKLESVLMQNQEGMEKTPILCETMRVLEKLVRQYESLLNK